MDLYRVLGLAGGLDGGAYATPSQIRSAYRSRSLLCHPDKRLDDPNAAAEEFKTLQDAYKVLSDENKRQDYDSELHSSMLKGPVIQPPTSKRKKKKKGGPSVSGISLFKKSGSSSKVKASGVSLEDVAKVKAMSGVTGEACERTVCVSWESPSGYDEAKLREVFSMFGSIEKVVAPKRCTKGVGAVIFRFKASAAGAVAGLRSDPELKLQMGA